MALTTARAFPHVERREPTMWVACYCPQCGGHFLVHLRRLAGEFLCERGTTRASALPSMYHRSFRPHVTKPCSPSEPGPKLIDLFTEGTP